MKLPENSVVLTYDCFTVCVRDGEWDELKHQTRDYSLICFVSRRDYSFVVGLEGLVIED